MPQMPVHWLNIRLVLTIFVALLGTIFLFLGLSRASPAPFYRSAIGPFSVRESSLQHVSNRTLGVSTNYFHSTVAGSRHHIDRPLTSTQFQKIFVINLPSRTDHRDSMSLAAALTDLQIDYVDGVTEVDNKTLPPGGKEVNLHSGALGNWRAHMNIARM